MLPLMDTCIIFQKDKPVFNSSGYVTIYASHEKKMQIVY